VASITQLAHTPTRPRRLPAAARTTVPIPVRAVRLWHLLSFDAPTVAALWTWFLATTNHIRLPLAAPLAMAVAVWMLYAADRLLDARILDSPANLTLDSPEDLLRELEARHLFHHRHRGGFRIGIVVCSLVLALLLPQLAPAAIRLYLVLGSLLFGYFLLIHSPGPNAERSNRLPKELAVGIFFSAATFVPTIAREPELRPALLPMALLFALLCSLNCLFIYAWEHSVPTPRTPPATRRALGFLGSLTLFTACAGLVLAGLSLHAPSRLAPWPIPAAATVSALLLLLLDRLHRSHSFLAPTTLRAAADLCLLTPLLFLPFLHG
jgi:hypothetical protein